MTAIVERTLPDVLCFIVDNRGRSCPTTPSGFPLIATNCLKRGRRTPVFENVRYVSEATYATWFRAHPKPGDVLFVTKGNAGRVAVVPDPVPFCIAQDMVALRAEPDLVDPGYLYYRLLAGDVQDSIANMHVGTLIPHFKKGDFDKLRFTVHESVLEQRAIADVLGAVDDKIAANDRIIDAAVELMVALGLSATETTTVGELATQTTRSLKPDAFDEVVAHYSLPAFDARQMPERAERETIKSNKFALGEPCVLISKLNPRIPRIWDVCALPAEMALGSTEFVTLIPREVSTSCLWAALSAPAVSTGLKGLVAGTSGSHQRVKPAELLNFQVGDPRSLADSVRDQITALGLLVHLRRRESERLAATRDELLPLLMSGKVPVRDAEEVVDRVV